MRRVRGKRILRLVITICAVLALSITAFAAETAVSSVLPDYSRRGSITVDILSADTGKAIPGGTMTLYEVAAAGAADGKNLFEPVGLFKESGISLATVNESDPGAEDLASSLETYVDHNKKITGRSVTVDENGKAKWTDLELGLYLVVHTAPASGYDAVNAFLITVPRYLDGAYVYDVNAAPKTGTANVSVQKTPVPASKTKVSGGKLPQTGQLWWPVPVFAFTGILLLMLGWNRRCHPERSSGVY